MDGDEHNQEVGEAEVYGELAHYFLREESEARGDPIRNRISPEEQILVEPIETGDGQEADEEAERIDDGYACREEEESIHCAVLIADVEVHVLVADVSLCLAHCQPSL